MMKALGPQEDSNVVASPTNHQLNRLSGFDSSQNSGGTDSLFERVKRRVSTIIDSARGVNSSRRDSFVNVNDSSMAMATSPSNGEK